MTRTASDAAENRLRQRRRCVRESPSWGSRLGSIAHGAGLAAAASCVTVIGEGFTPRLQQAWKPEVLAATSGSAAEIRLRDFPWIVNDWPGHSVT